MKSDQQSYEQLQAQLFQAQKMEAVGRLAGGVAHDFNNLLTVIMSAGEIMTRRLHEKDPLRRHVAQIQKAASRAESLTRQLLAFSRRQIMKVEVVDLGAVAEGLIPMLRRLLGEKYEISQDLAASDWRVMADKGQIEQVLMNLAVNAQDAMPDGGKLNIETAEVNLDESMASTQPDAKTGPHVMLAVSDNGVGMAEEIRAQIFEPFFTTKPRGKGTGLGLSTVYGIVKQSGGCIFVTSVPGQGASFKIYLPRVEAKDAPRPSVETEVDSRPSSGKETVMVVEDEDMVRALTVEILELAGYTVLEASTGEDALRLLKAHSKPVQLLLTDVVLPGMSGSELSRSLVAGNEKIKVLFMSGYTDDAIVRQGVLDRGVAFLPKPFSLPELTRRVRELLDYP